VPLAVLVAVSRVAVSVSIGITAVEDTKYVVAPFGSALESDSPVADTESELVRGSLELSDITVPRSDEALHRIEHPTCSFAIEASQIRLCSLGENKDRHLDA